MRKIKPVIYLDMDGVCDDFASAGIIANGREPKEIFKKWECDYKGEFFPYIVMAIDRDTYWQNIHDAGEEFWINLNEYKWFKDLYGSLNKIADVYFLSSSTRYCRCLSGKLIWLQRRFGVAFDKYIFTTYKNLLVNEYTLLIDDYNENVKSFAACGGNSILFPQIWNDNHGIKDKLDYTIEQVIRWNDKFKLINKDYI